MAEYVERAPKTAGRSVASLGMRLGLAALVVCSCFLFLVSCSESTVSQADSPQSDQDQLRRIREQLRKEPNSAFLHNQAAVILTKMKDYESAKSELEESRRIDPKNPITHAQIAFVYRLLKDYESEMESLRKAVELDPENPAIRYNLCDALDRAGNVDEAIKECQRALDVAPAATKEYHDPRGNFYSIENVRKNAAETIRQLERIREGKPRS